MDKISPLVSVLIPCYNHEKFIKQALDSIINDEYLNKEIVIINDGSKDSSNEIIEKWRAFYNDSIKIKYISRENKGICATLNELIEISNGKYVLLLASDDALYGNTITERVSILEEREPEGKLVLVSDALVVDENNEILGQSSMSGYSKGNKNKYKTDEGILEEVILNPSINGPVVLINKKIYARIGKYPEYMNTEDWFFYQRAAAIGSIIFWDKTVALYRIHSSNTSRTFSSTQIKLLKSIIKTLYINLNWFPSLKFKFFGGIQIIRYLTILMKVRLKKLIGQ